MKLAVFIAIASSLMIAGGLYQAYNSVDKTSVTYPTPVYDSWAHWKKHNGKSYGTNTEEEYRLKMYANNFQYIGDNQKPEHTFEMNLNKFADLGLDEFVANFGGIQWFLEQQHKGEETRLPKPENFAESKDWTGVATTPVKNQGSCGSCWAFASTGGIEGAYAVKTGHIHSFSEQQLVDCSTANHGCNGGMMMGAYDYVKENGILQESEYAYTGQEGHCQYSTKVSNPEALTKVTGYTMVPSGDESQLAIALDKQPVSVAIMATSAVQLYKHGIFNDSSCGGGINHGVLAVGYASDYFKVKNSWGENWGESGFIRFARTGDASGMCSITTVPVYPNM